MPTCRMRAYAFTLYDHEDEGLLRHFMTQFNTKYWCAGDEVCPSTGKQHWQGWIYLKEKMSFNKLKKFFGSTHFEQVRDKVYCPSTKKMKNVDWVKLNEEYCQKCRDEGKTIITEGICPKQGIRTDLERARERKSVREHFRKDEPNYQSIRVLEKKLEYTERPKWRNITKVMVPADQVAGTVGDQDVYYYSSQTDQTRWPGYDGQKVVVTSQSDSYNLMNILNGMPHRVNTGGTSRLLRVTTWVIITDFPMDPQKRPEVAGGNTRNPPLQTSMDQESDYE